jgi:flavin reductase (DIM6/NTAB) family NADH-FMN oxidoreductase RutF
MHGPSHRVQAWPMNDQANNPTNNSIVALFRKLTLGVYVVGVTDGRTHDAFTAASVTQVAYRPLLLSLAFNPEHASYGLLLTGRTWTISVLRSDQIELARRFGTAASGGKDKMDGISWGTGRLGAPYLEQALAYFDCRLAAEFPAGDHRIIVGRVIDGAVLAPYATPLTYAQTGNLDQSAAFYPDRFGG